MLWRENIQILSQCISIQKHTHSLNHNKEVLLFSTSSNLSRMAHVRLRSMPVFWNLYQTRNFASDMWQEEPLVFSLNFQPLPTRTIDSNDCTCISNPNFPV